MPSSKSGSHEKLIAWQMADSLDLIVREILESLPGNEFRTRSQIDSASDSIGANIVEGYYSNSTAEFIRFLRYARRSCGELGERIRRVYRKNFISKELFEKADDMVIRTGYILDRLMLSLGDKLDRNKKS